MRSLVFIICTAFVVMAALVMFAGLAFGWAAVGFCVLGLAAVAANAQSGSVPSVPAVPDSAALPGQGRLEMLRLIADALPDPVMLLDENAKILAANKPAGLVFERIDLNDHVSSVIRSPRVLEAIDYARASGESVMIDYEHRVPIDRRFELHIVRVGSGYGQAENAGVPATLLLLRDLTRQEQVERMRADFVANASHELRTPLASVLGFIETLQGAARNDEKARTEFLELMRSQAARMARLIDDLLSLNSIELNAHVRPNDPVDVVLVVAHVAEILKPLADDSGVVLVVETPPMPLIIPGDRDELIQVFQNLVENAIKYGQAGGKVDIGFNTAKDTVNVTVRDHGPGIPAEHVPRITERFYRVDVTQSRQKGGTGLGLAIVKHILNRHRARLAVKSTPGEGTSFSVTLPTTFADIDTDQVG